MRIAERKPPVNSIVGTTERFIQERAAVLCRGNPPKADGYPSGKGRHRGLPLQGNKIGSIKKGRGGFLLCLLFEISILKLALH
jgi:hypothetical protein